MKLLASLIGCAVADYACCPYDDFGVVNALCPLSEKTPWAMQDANVNGDPMGVEHHLCKAWEANIDATMEGNENKDNWGGCGFQRHFPWSTPNAKVTDTTVANTEQCNMGMFDCTGGVVVSNNYKRLSVFGTNFDLDAGSFTNGGVNQVLGQVTLGGVCKLFIPVSEGNIDSVHIAGVHMSGGNASGGLNARVCSTTTCDSQATASPTGVDGTAYCFSVVNIGEWMENHMPGSNFNVMNGNVAGKDEGGHDPILLEGPTSEQAFDVNFGSSIRPSGAAGGTGTIVEAGASFDVVVHFKSDWCIRHWTIVDMQTSPDWHSGGTDDYPLADDISSNPQHAHTDVADKRFMAGLCGCCKSDLTTKHDTTTGDTTSAEDCFECNAATCVEFNTYKAMALTVNSDFKWPNAGAWAAYYSFITCANSEFMVYETVDTIAAGVITTTTSPARTVVHSMFYNDIRHDHTNAHGATGSVVIRGNIRQVGDQVKYCGPGEMPDSSLLERCTWNWNFMLGTNDLAEEWFSRTNPSNVNVWNGATGAEIERDDLDAGLFTPTLITSVVKQIAFTVELRSDDTVSTTAARAFTLDADKYFTAPAETSTAAGHIYTFTMHCLKSSLDGTGDPIAATGLIADLGAVKPVVSRDMFPDCYMGDEIHFNFVSTEPSTGTGDERISAWYSLSSAIFA